MATTTARPPAQLWTRALSRPAGALAAVGALSLAGLAISLQMPGSNPLVALPLAALPAIAGWLLLSERYEWSLAVLMLYVGLADGYLKLSTGSSQATLLRDMLLYAIATGALIRLAVRRESPSWPPLSGWVIAWAAVVAVQVANPHNGTLLHSIASFRPHLEWVPLFFLGYLAIRSKARIRNFLVLLVAIAAVNGVVGLIQQNMTPEQLAGWGPGYEQAISGEGTVAARRFADEEGTERNRPFALGGDIGFGGSVGVLAVPAALALLGLSLRPGLRLVVGVLAIGVAIAILSSAARVHVIAGVVAILAYAGLTVTSRGGMRTVVGAAVGLLIGYAAIGFLFSNSEKGSFDRYEDINSPSKAVSTAYDYRRDVIALIPVYMSEIPLGAGLGSKGPAGSFGGGGSNGLNAESEPTYLLIELGIPGLAVMLGFQLALLYLCLTRIRRIPDREARVLLTAVAAPLFALFSTWFVGISTAATPGAPYLWFAAGVLSYWLLGDGYRSLVPARPAPALGAGAPAWRTQWSSA
jgi:hypothetical protein